jgi:hypothetical protein
MGTYMHLCLPWLFKLPYIYSGLQDSECYDYYGYFCHHMCLVTKIANLNSYSYVNAPEVFSSADVSYLVIILSLPPMSMRSVGHISEV